MTAQHRVRIEILRRTPDHSFHFQGWPIANDSDELAATALPRIESSPERTESSRGGNGTSGLEHASNGDHPRRRSRRRPIPEMPSETLPADGDPLFLQYIKAGRPLELRNKIWLAYMPIVTLTADRIHKKLPNHVDFEDLVDFGQTGLLECIAAFDPRKGVKFPTFASPRIRGAILDGIREQDWVPRLTRGRWNRFERMRLEFIGSHGRAPNRVEELRLKAAVIRDKSGVTNATLDEEVCAPRSLISINGYSEGWGSQGDGNKEEEFIATLAATVAQPDERPENRDFLEFLFRRLHGRARDLLELYYGHGIALKSIGELWGLSESRVSQFHTAVIIKLRLLARKHLGLRLEEEGDDGEDRIDALLSQPPSASSPIMVDPEDESLYDDKRFRFYRGGGDADCD